MFSTKNIWRSILILSMFIVSSIVVEYSFGNNNMEDSYSTNAVSIDFYFNLTLTDYCGNTPVILDIDLDGMSEILVTSQNGYFYCLDYLGRIQWQYKLGALGRCSPTVVDINKDGELEILITSSNALYCFAINGTVLWETTITYNMADSPAVADLDQDGYLDIILKSTEKLQCFNYNGTKKWEAENYGAVTTMAVVADLDSDNTFEIIFGVNLDNIDHRIICLNHYGVQEWDHVVGDRISSNIAVADLDEDGTKEIIFGIVTHYLRCINHQGVTEWSHGLGGAGISDPIIADLDGDGNLEIIEGADSGTISCIDFNGDLLWSIAKGYSFFGDIIVANIDGNQDLEILVQYADEILYYYNSTGHEQYSRPFSGEFISMASGYLDYDNIADLVVGHRNAVTSDHEILGIRFTGISQSGPQQWYCSRGGMFNTGQMDSDGDLIDDMTEEFYDGNPNLKDTDTDGLEDGWEVFHGTDLTNSDTDSDGLTDGIEVFTMPTGPLNNDTDSDNLLDGEEILGMYLPLNPGANATGYVHTNPLLADSDGDGFNDDVELLANSDPNDELSIPKENLVWLWWVIGSVLALATLVIVVFVTISIKKKKQKSERQIEPTEVKRRSKEIRKKKKRSKSESKQAAAKISLEENLKKILSSYSKISLDLMAKLLEFKNTMDLQRWIINLPGEKVFYIEGNEIIIPKDLKGKKLDSIIESLDQVKHTTCYYCGLPIESEDTECSGCKKEVLVCSVCKLPISFGEVVGSCSLCESKGHLIHLQEWVKTQGKCPTCLQSLPIEGIIPEEQNEAKKK